MAVKIHSPDQRHYVIKKGSSGKTYFILKAENGQGILGSQGYDLLSHAKADVVSVGKTTPNASVFGL